MHLDQSRDRKPGKPFARWLLDQQHRPDPIGRLALAARGDPRFPRDGDYRTVSIHLSTVGADGDMHGSLEDAGLDYDCC